ncbi:MAG TPA: Asp-tRNA(Asn)/Glu-tRNA(Gln) amidotransferase subunit GatC [Gemmatimonadales bacterium]|nr:Asp-tRNA(Asn)/Glu-tRNA(Gln) amidotransferase subunit GatC [Gemmatimonadales bacterium]
MSIGREQVLHVAALAEVGVDEPDLPKLVDQLNRIVGYVEQLEQVHDAPAEPFLAGPAATPLRDDVVGPVPLARPPAAIAPEFRDGFFLVPRHGAMEEL